jgi:hypothetical protein
VGCSSCSACGPGTEWASWDLPFRRKGSVQTAGWNGAASHPTLPTAPPTPAAGRRMQLPSTGSGTSLTRSSCPVNDLAASFLSPDAPLACPPTFLGLFVVPAGGDFGQLQGLTPEIRWCLFYLAGGFWRDGRAYDGERSNALPLVIHLPIS